jgi:UDP-N-acetylmuramoyl-L-alanyl-D-glutamate--2,6-diaminopimelate ligase
MKAKELLNTVNVIEGKDKLDINISGVAYDSRNVKKGDVFVCIKGFKTDGHDFINDAIKKGAVLIVCQNRPEISVPYVIVEDTRHALAIISCNFYDNPSKKFKLIGVTGTNGKTSTTYILKSILENANKKVGLIGTNQNMIGQKVIKSKHTTPESLELQALLSEMYDCGMEYVVMEVSSHSLELKRVDGCVFEIGIFTNLTQDHLDFHEDMQSYLDAKKKLFNMSRIAVLNRDDNAFSQIKNSTSAKTYSFSINYNDADLIAKNIRQKYNGVEFEVLSNNDIERLEINIPGKFSIYNALGGALAALKLGIGFEQIKYALKEFDGVKGRAELVNIGTDFSVMIDYAHTPDGLLNIINTINEYKKGRLITLFGCGGDRDNKKRHIMGDIATQLSDICIITSDNPRSEDPQKIIEEIVSGIKKGTCEYVTIENRKEAIKYGLSISKKDDILLLAGKGHEDYQILKDKTIEFDERKIVKELASELFK